MLLDFRRNIMEKSRNVIDHIYHDAQKNVRQPKVFYDADAKISSNLHVEKHSESPSQNSSMNSFILPMGK